MSSTFVVTPLREALRSGLPALTNMFSPTKNPCVVKVTPMKGMRRFRYDPYKASVIAPSVMTPEKTASNSVSPAKFASFGQPAAPMPQVAAAQYYTPYPMMPAAAGYYAAPMPYDMMPQVAAPEVVYPSPYDTAPNTRMSAAPMSLPPIAIDATEDIAAAPCRSSSLSSVDRDEETVTRYAIVKFKHDTYPYMAPFRVAIGDIVLVEGDRGENLGTVKEITTVKPTRPVAYKVIRKANPKDRELLTSLRRKEQAASKFCEAAVKEHGLNMSIVDTEYQYDGQKLSIYYKSKGMVDFRRLQRVLFREFRCRVWLVNWSEVETELTH